MSKAVHDPDDESGEHYAIVADLSSLTADREAAVLMLRVGAAVNAIRACQRLTLEVEDAPGPRGEHDRFATFLLATGFLKEGIDRLYSEFERVESFARAGGATDENVQRARALWSKEPTSPYRRLLSFVRNKVGFHFDPEPFEAWIAKVDSDPVEWIRGVGEKERTVVFVAAANAIVSSIASNEAEFKDVLTTALDISATLISFLHAAHIGFLRAHNMRRVVLQKEE